MAISSQTDIREESFVAALLPADYLSRNYHSLNRVQVVVMAGERDAASKSLETNKRAAWQVLAAGVGAAVIAGVFQVTVAIIGRTPPPANSNPSVCVVALRNVEEASDHGVKRDSPVMSAINPDSVDQQCGTEQELLASIGR